MKSQFPRWAWFLIYSLFSFIVYTHHLDVFSLEYRDDEIFYVKSTQEMSAQANYLSPTYFGENRFQKPILFYWLIILFYKLFGVSWVSARLVSSVFGALTIAVSWLLADKLFNKRIAHLSALILMTTPMFVRHAKAAVPDMAMNFFIILSIYFIWEFSRHCKEKKYGLLAVLCMSFGFLIKGFAVLIVPFFTFLIWTLVERKIHLWKEFPWRWGTLIFILSVVPWFLFMYVKFGNVYTHHMIVEETKGRLLGEGWGNFLHNITAIMGHLLFYFQVIGTYFAPWSFYFLIVCALLIFEIRRNKLDSVRMLLWIWVGSTVLFFSFMTFIINHYMLVITTPMAMLIAQRINSFDYSKDNMRKILKIFTIIFYILGAGVMCFLHVYLTDATKMWLFFYFALLAFVGFAIWRNKSLYYFISSLAFLLVFIYANGYLLTKARLTTHTTWQRMTSTLSSDSENIVVGSNDIHEKEIQAFLTSRVQRVTDERHDLADSALSSFIRHRENSFVYCFITEADLNRFATINNDLKYHVLDEAFVVRKRFYLNKEFLKALVSGDQKVVKNFIVEKIMLIKWGKDV